MCIRDRYNNDLYQFLKKKGYSDELLKDSGLFNVDERHGMYDKFWNRVIYPIMDVNNQMCIRDRSWALPWP